MIEALFGGETAAKCLVYLAAMDEGYPLEIATAYGISNTQVIRTLNKLEQAEVLIGREAGRSRLYALNPRYIVAKELKALLKRVLMTMPMEEQEKIFMRRKRPRKKGKVIMHTVGRMKKR